MDFISIFIGIGSVLGFIIAAWLLYQFFTWFTFMLKNAMKSGWWKTIVTFFIIFLVAGSLLVFGVVQGGKALVTLENETLPQLAQESKLFARVYNVLTAIIYGNSNPFCALAPNISSCSGQSSVAPNAAGGYQPPAGSNNQFSLENDANTDPQTVATPIPRYVLSYSGEALVACAKQGYAALNIAANMPTGSMPYPIRLDGSAPVVTDWAAAGTQMVVVLVHSGANHMLVYNENWGTSVRYDDGTGKKLFVDRLGATPIDVASAKQLIASWGMAVPDGRLDVWSLAGTGNYPHQCYSLEGASAPSPVSPPPVAAAPTTPTPEPTPASSNTTMTCHYNGAIGYTPVKTLSTWSSEGTGFGLSDLERLNKALYDAYLNGAYNQPSDWLVPAGATCPP